MSILQVFTEMNNVYKAQIDLNKSVKHSMTNIQVGKHRFEVIELNAMLLTNYNIEITSNWGILKPYYIHNHINTIGKLIHAFEYIICFKGVIHYVVTGYNHLKTCCIRNLSDLYHSKNSNIVLSPIFNVPIY